MKYDVSPAIGLLLRILFCFLGGTHLRSLDVNDAESLCCLPFCHLEAIVLGILMGHVFHGLIIALGLNGAGVLRDFPPLVSNTLVFIITLLEAASLAAVFILARHRLFGNQRWTKDPPVN